MAEEEKETKEVATKQSTLLDIQREQFEQMDVLTQDIIQNSDENNEKADEMYQYMKDLIDLESDKSDSTREMMGKALEIKVDSNSQKIELLKIKAKLLNPGKAQTSVNINLGDYDPSKGADTNSMIDIVEGLREEED